ncbi:MAG TPA: DUF488 domain-containing protein [Candidatus Baltobacteraceae bacterium]|jgi:uncharacterized protein (DUF488 family)|nr:DUF488 domain-containing protein [Candidatus Baltobacteraceae bacterium]
MKAVRNGYTDEAVDLYTFGHGTLTQAEIAQLVKRAGLARVVDVRTVPKSRTHPWVWSDQMAAWIPEEAGAEYVWERDLGGFRTPQPTSHHTALRNPSFRGYADYMETERFLSALNRLVESLPQRKTAIMCSETLWWRCHRRLIADAATLLHGVNVSHLMPTGRSQPHVLTEGVRRVDDTLRYDGNAA